MRVTGDLRRDLFRHLTGHSPSFFSDQLPGMLTSRITATSNAVFTMENMFVWNVLPPCLATVAAIVLIATISVPMASVLLAAGCTIVIAMFRLAAAGRPLHHDFAAKAAAVDGEMVDVVTNMALVKSFCGIMREQDRFDATVDREMASRRRSLIYLEKLRLAHAAITAAFTIGLVAWAIMLWQRGAASPGDVVLVCTLGLSVLHATRDLAVALVDVTQHVARLSESLGTLLVQHELQDHPKAAPLVRHGAVIEFDNVSFAFPNGQSVFRNFRLRFESDQRIGLIGLPGAENRRCLPCCKDSTTCRRAASSSMAKTLHASRRTACVLQFRSYRRTFRSFSVRSWKIFATVARMRPTKTSLKLPRRRAANSSATCLAGSTWWRRSWR